MGYLIISGREGEGGSIAVLEFVCGNIEEHNSLNGGTLNLSNYSFQYDAVKEAILTCYNFVNNSEIPTKLSPNLS